MPTLEKNGWNKIFGSAGAAVLAAAIIGGWAFATTRASGDDLKEIVQEVETVEEESKERDVTIQKKLDRHLEQQQVNAIQQATFRAQVRGALNIRTPVEPPPPSPID